MRILYFFLLLNNFFSICFHSFFNICLKSIRFVSFLAFSTSGAECEVEGKWNNRTNKIECEKCCVCVRAIPFCEWENDVPIRFILSLARIQSKFHMDAHSRAHFTSIDIYTDNEWIKKCFTYHLWTLYHFEARCQMNQIHPNKMMIIKWEDEFIN